MSWFTPSRRASALAALSCLGMVAALAVASSPASGAAKVAGVPSCQTAGLVVWLNTNGNGAAGSVTYNLEFSNLSGHTCTLRGYPGVSAVGLRGQRLGSAATHGTNFKVKTITLKSGDAATAALQIVEAGNYPASKCHLTTAAGLRVFPPNQTASKTVPYPFPACALSGPDYLGVQAVRG
jgi:hypothetical protein